MPFRPISGAPFQYQKANGALAQNYYVKFYRAGTTTPIFCAANENAEDELGAELKLDKVRLDTGGYPVNPSGGRIVIFLEEKYKVALFKTAADADSNLINEADWVVDNLAPGLLGLTEEEQQTLASDIDYTASGTATTRTVADRLGDFISVKDFGATGDGNTDDSVAFTTALLSNSNVYVPEGTYLVGGIIVQNFFQSLHFAGNVSLLANANDVVLLKQVTSFSHHTGSVTLDSNGYTNVTGVQCGPSDLTDTTTVSNQRDNIMPVVIGSPGVAELVVVQAGPDVAGTDSYNLNNTWPAVYTRGATRGMWYKGAANATGFIPSGDVIHNFVADNTNGTNTGIDIEGGSEIKIHSFYANAITSGGSPNSTATAFKLDQNDSVTGMANQNVTIYGGSIIGCSRDLETRSISLKLGNLDYSDSNSTFGNRPLHPIWGREPDEVIYMGSVNSNYTGRKLPNGWSVASAGTGYYRITHNLNNTFYGVVATVENGNLEIISGVFREHVCNISSLTSNYFDVAVFENDSSSGEVRRPADFSFILLKY